MVWPFCKRLHLPNPERDLFGLQLRKEAQKRFSLTNAGAKMINIGFPIFYALWVAFVMWPAAAVWGVLAATSSASMLFSVLILIYGAVILAVIPFILLRFAPKIFQGR